MSGNANVIFARCPRFGGIQKLRSANLVAEIVLHSRHGVQDSCFGRLGLLSA